MRLNGEQVDEMRRNAEYLLNWALPFKPGDETYAEVCKDYGGSGTTCAFLCHWLMWRLGVIDVSRINRAEGAGKERPALTYTHGANISRIVQDYKPPFVKTYGTNAWLVGKRPDVGDICFIFEAPSGPQVTEHVFCFMSGEATGPWRTAEAGQDFGTHGKFRTDRVLLPGLKLSGNSPNRHLMGWLPLDELEFGPPPKPLPFPFI
jgi:hypothetical protein